jgi:D-aspartate ligase
MTARAPRYDDAQPRRPEPNSERVLRAHAAVPQDTPREPTPPAGLPSSAMRPRLVAARDSHPAPVPGRLPPALLTTPDYYGTLAAVRSLGRSGVSVTVASPSRWSLSGSSKYATGSVRCPPVLEATSFIDWLCEFGATHEKHVLLPTCDDTAWLYALNRERLSEYFHLSVPEIGAIHQLLDKSALHEHAVQAGLLTPPSWRPESFDDVERIAREARFPVALKPVTQVLYRTRRKGVRVDRPEDLAPMFRAFANHRHERSLLAFDPALSMPLVQEYYPEAATGIYNLSGFARGGRVIGVLASRKLLQRPRRMGVGVCFEEAPVMPDLVAGVERLTARVGFNGVFETEFIEHEGTPMLIDFNPRFYNQMAFDIARGLPLPLLAYHYALGDQERVSRLCEEHARAPGSSGRVYAHRTGFRLLVGLQGLSGAFSKDEATAWNEWYRAHRERCVDPVYDADDPWPSRLDVGQVAKNSLRHPRAFLRSVVLDRD